MDFIIFKNNNQNIQVYYKRYAYVDNSLKNIIRKIPINSLFIDSQYSSQQGTKDLRMLFDNYKLFDSPKSVALMEELLKAGINSEDIILDFFAGSGTTAHAVLDLNKKDNGNRKFICVQLPEATREKSIAFKAGYKNICEIGKDVLEELLKKIKEEQKQQKLSDDNEQDLGFKVFKLDRSNFKTWDGFTKDFKQL
jgi:adenine-specific DNA-methyltransferase